MITFVHFRDRALNFGSFFRVERGSSVGRGVGGGGGGGRGGVTVVERDWVGFWICRWGKGGGGVGGLVVAVAEDWVEEFRVEELGCLGVLFNDVRRASVEGDD